MTSTAPSPASPPLEPSGAAAADHADRPEHPRFRRICARAAIVPSIPEQRAFPPAPSIPEQSGHLVGRNDAAATARRRAESVLRMALEIMEGRRPVTQLAPFVTPSVVRYVAAAAESPPGRGTRTALRPPAQYRLGGPGLRSLRVLLPRPDAAEIAAVCRFQGRVRAVAGRMRLTERREWRCVALRML